MSQFLVGIDDTLQQGLELSLLICCLALLPRDDGISICQPSRSSSERITSLTSRSAAGTSTAGGSNVGNGTSAFTTGTVSSSTTGSTLSGIWHAAASGKALRAFLRCLIAAAGFSESASFATRNTAQGTPSPGAGSA